MFADRQLRMMIIRVEDDAVIGTIDITEFSPMHARGEVGIAIRKEYQGNGYAKEALRLLCDYEMCIRDSSNNVEGNCPFILKILLLTTKIVQTYEISATFATRKTPKRQQNGYYKR